MRIISCVCCLPWLLLSAAAIPQPSQNSISPDLRPYLGARTILDCSAQEVLRTYPELKGLEFSETQDELASLLRKVGEAVETMFASLPSTSSLERISQERTEPGQTEQLYLKQNYHYLVLPQTAIAGVGFEEYRTNLKDERLNPEELKGSFLLTSGYATHPVYFHPKQQPESRFRYLGRQKSERNAHVIAFAQRPEAAETMRYLATRNQNISILLQGIAWIDPDSYQVIRMRSDLLAPRKDVSLEFQTTTIRFGEVRFNHLSQILWLPLEVVVTMKYQGYLFRNRHHYSQYRLFTVESQEGAKVPVRP
jgi:hypothetical protein